MTGLETHMQENGWTLTHGKSSEWNTYDNCNRSWLHTSGKRLLIGLLAQPTRVGVISPQVYNNERVLVVALPTIGFDQFLEMFLHESLPTYETLG